MTRTPSRPDVAAIMAKAPAHARAELAAVEADRVPVSELSLTERAARFRKEVEEESAAARAELLSNRAAARWAMWCHEVPAIYRDERADCDDRQVQTYAWWLAPLNADQHAAKIAAWLGDPEARTLWLIGNTGTGKSHAACAAGYAAAARAVHVRFTTQLDYLRQLRPGGADEPNRVRQRFATTSLLVLDDFGAETGEASQFVRQEMLGLLDERLSEGRRQIITTNAEADELCNVFGDRIMSRLRANAAAIRFEGPDLRVARQPW